MLGGPQLPRSTPGAKEYFFDNTAQFKDYNIAHVLLFSVLLSTTQNFQLYKEQGSQTCGRQIICSPQSNILRPSPGPLKGLSKELLPGMKLMRVWGVVNSPNLENLPFCKAKTVVQCTSAGQLTGSRTTGELPLLKKDKKCSKCNL